MTRDKAGRTEGREGRAGEALSAASRKQSFSHRQWGSPEALSAGAEKVRSRFFISCSGSQGMKLD